MSNCAMVSIHAPARGATRESGRTSPHDGFNSRAREGRDPPSDLVISPPYGFNSRAREGRDKGKRNGRNLRRVSIHAPARGATMTIWRPHQIARRFNSRAREGRDYFPPSNQIAHYVSIHAPARGATQHLPYIIDEDAVSIHAPARGATGGDMTKSDGGKVSIHAPARGATQHLPYIIDEDAVSIHAPARGATA